MIFIDKVGGYKEKKHFWNRFFLSLLIGVVFNVFTSFETVWFFFYKN